MSTSYQWPDASARVIDQGITSTFDDCLVRNLVYSDFISEHQTLCGMDITLNYDCFFLIEKMKIKLFNIVVIIILLGCSSDRKVNLSKKLDDKSGRSIFLIKDTIQIKIPFSSYNIYHTTDLFDDRYLYGINLLSPMQLNVCDLAVQEHIKQINLDPNLIKASQISNIYIQSPDSIYFLSDLKSIIYLINSNGQVIDKWSSSEIKISFDQDSVLNRQGFGFATSSSLEGPWLDENNEHLFVKLSPFSSVDEVGDINVKRHGIYNLKERKWESIFGCYRGVLKQKKDGRYYYDMHHPYQLVLADKIYVTYPVDPVVYCYNKETKQYLGEINNKISFSEDFPSPLYGNKALNYSKMLT